MIRYLSLIVISLSLLAGCGFSQSQPTTINRPAVVSHPNSESTLLITQALGELLKGPPVEIAPNALSKDNLLVIHRGQLTGRDISAATDQFRLLKNDEHCFLLHENTGNLIEIKRLSCQYMD